MNFKPQASNLLNPSFLCFFKHQPNHRTYQKDDGSKKKDHGNRPIDKDAEIAMGDHQRLPESNLQFRPENQSQEKWRTFISQFPHQKSHTPEEKHHPNIENRIIHGIHSCNAKKDDEG